MGSSYYQFYASTIGQCATKIIGKALRQLWPNVKGKTILGIGHVDEYLKLFEPEAQGCFGFHLKGQPVEANVVANNKAVVDEVLLPLDDGSVDLIFVIHGLELSEMSNEFIEELGRVLKDSGKLCICVPNSKGLWARFSNNPFSGKRSYSLKQLIMMLRAHNFTPTQFHNCLYFPPFNYDWMVRLADFLEQFCYDWFEDFSGVLVVEAVKEYLKPALVKPVKKPFRFLKPAKIS